MFHFSRLLKYTHSCTVQCSWRWHFWGGVARRRTFFVTCTVLQCTTWCPRARWWLHVEKLQYVILRWKGKLASCTEIVGRGETCVRSPDRSQEVKQFRSPTKIIIYKKTSFGLVFTMLVFTMLVFYIYLCCWSHLDESLVVLHLF